VFDSSAPNLVSGDSNGVIDVFLHDRDADGDGVFDEPGAISTTRISVDSVGDQSNGNSYDPKISADGSTVVFTSSASNLVAGDIDIPRTKALVERWFNEIPRGADVEPIAPPSAILTEVKKKTLTDRVALERLYLAWLTPRMYAPGDASLDMVSSVLTGGKNSRLYKRLVYDTQVAQDVTAFQQSGAIGSEFQIIATARRGHTAAELQKVIDEELEKLRREAPEPREVQRAINQIEASFYRRMERVSNKADSLNGYYFAGGGPDYFAEDLARYTSLSPSDVQAAAIRWLPADRRVEVIVVPEAKK